MRRILLLIFFLATTSALIGAVNPNQRQFNFSSFSTPVKNTGHELDLLTPEPFRLHPDYGILPYNKPCEDCIELEDHRDASSRYFVEKGTAGKRFYQMQSYSAINYLDPSGWWREINYRLKPKSENVFEASDQPNPVAVNLKEKFSSIRNQNKEIRFNKNLELNHVDREGKTHSLGTPDWSHFTAGDDGVLVKDFYPGVDLQMIAFEGKMKTNFILNGRLLYSDGWLVMKQKFVLPSGMSFNLDETEKNEDGHLFGDIILNDEQQEYFRIFPSVAYDAGGQRNIIKLGNKVNPAGELLTYIPISWLNAANTIYPVIIDPIVSTSGSFAAGAITGSRYSAACWTNGCTYNFALPSPVNCTITDIRFSFDYTTGGLCVMTDGGISFNYGACRSPAAGAISCGLPFAGTCVSGVQSLMSDFAPCLPPPQCSSYNMNFTMNFYRCNQDPSLGCSSACIAAASAWTMTIVGETFSISTLTPNLLMCAGVDTNLVVTCTGGVPPYTYLWTPTGSTNDSILVAPLTTTVYHILASDACFINEQDSTTVTVTPNTNPGFTATPNPACIGQNITFTGLGAGPAANYDWQFPGSNNPAVNNSQSVVIQYATQGIYTATLNYPNGTCIFPSQQTINIDSTLTPSVTVTSSVPGPVCTGTTVVFTATPVNGGTLPSYQWKINGVNAGTNSDTFSVALSSSSTVSVTLTSNSPCVTSATASGQVIFSVTSGAIPTVNITSNIVPPFCTGTTVVFTATPTYGGSNPSYQWQLNGSNIGTNSDTISISNLTSGNIVGVTLTSNLTCASPLTANDTVHTVVFPTVVAGVSIIPLPNDTVCAGTNVQFNATPVNGGGTPAYQWSLNNVPIAGAVFNSYSTNTISNGNVIRVTMTSSSTCATPIISADSVTMRMVPNVAPVVNISVSPNDTVCTGSNVVFTAIPTNGGTSPSYQWKVNGVNAGTNSDTFSVSLNSTSTILVTMTSNYPCLTLPAISRQMVVTVISSVLPTVNIISTPPPPYCIGANVIFTAVPTFGGSSPSYQWNLNGINGGVNSDTFSIAGIINGDIIKVTMTSAFGCASPSIVTDTIHATTITNVAPVVAITANPGFIFCNGTPVTFTANPTNGGSTPTYQWYLNGSSTGTGNSYSSSLLNNSDSISVIMTSSLSCASPIRDTTSSVVTVNASIAPAVSIAANPAGIICAGTAVHFAASPTNGGTIPSYQWLINGAPIAGATFDSITIASFLNNDIVRVRMTSNINCALPATVTDSIIMSVTPSVTPAVSVQVSPNDTACVGDNLQFTAITQNGGTAPVYQWHVNAGNAGTNSSSFASSTLNTGDVVTVSLTSNAVCSSPVNAVSSPVTLTIHPFVTPSVSITSTPPDTICVGASIVFLATPVNGGTTPSYQWTVNGIANGGNNSSFTSSALVQGDAVTVQMTSNEMCITSVTTASNSILISTYPLVNVIATGNADVCPKTPVVLQAIASGGKGAPYNYSWDHAAGNSGTVTVTPVVTTTYTVSATDACASPLATASVLVTIKPAPTALYSYSPNDPTSLNPEVTFTDLSAHAINWLWHFGDGDTSTVQNPAHRFPATGTYDVSLVVLNVAGCTDTVSFRIIVKEDLAFFVPNSFSPNGDGKNETFSPMGSSITDFEMIIYDRWGNEIFVGGPLNPWTGTIKGGKELAPVGMYIYRIDLKDSKFDKQIVTGGVTLIR